MLQQLFGTELSSPMRIIIALIVIAALLGATVAIFRRLNGGTGERVNRGRQGPRLAVLDAVAVDQRRRLVLVRRDGTEHLLLIGGSSDIVVETQIPAAVEEEPAREAVPQQRPSRRISASPAPAALTAAAVEAIAAPQDPAPLPAPAPAAEPEAERSLRRRPLLRGDGTLSGRERPSAPPAARLAAGEPASPSGFAGPAPAIPAPAALAAAAASPAQPAPDAAVLPPQAPLAARREPVVSAPAPQEAAPDIAAELRAGPREDAEKEPQLDDMARRLDAALAGPPARGLDTGAPQLDLADLLGDLAAESNAADAEPEAPPAPAARVERAQPERRPAERPLPERAQPERPPAAPERVVGRPMRGVRPPPPRISPEPRVPAEPRLRPEPAVRPERSPLPGFATPTRPDPRGATAPRPEQGMRLREFSLRPADPAPRPGASVDPVVRPAPMMELGAPDPIAAPSPVVASAPPVAIPANDAGPEPAAREPAGKEPSTRDSASKEPPARVADDFTAALDDFDSEMANLLGRTSSRGG